MPRIRTVKPEFWADEKLAPLKPITRLVFLGLWSMADDAGRVVDNRKQIDAFIFPETDDSAWESLAILETLGRVSRGITESGQRVIQIINWSHQKIDKPNMAAALPPIVEVSTIDRGGFPESVVDSSRPISTTYDHLSTTSDPLSPVARRLDGKADQVSVDLLLTTESDQVNGNGHRPEIVLLDGKRPREHTEITAHLTSVLGEIRAGRQERLKADEMRTVQAELVFAYWQAELGHEKALLDDDRLNRLRKHLKANKGNIHELLYAIDGWPKDPTFRRLAETDGRKLDDIDNIFKDRARIERLAGHCKGYRDGSPHRMAVKYLEVVQS